MAHTETTAGGEFLTSTVHPDEVFVRDDLSDEQQLFGRTAAEFMRHEALPVVDRLYRHDWQLTRRLIHRAGELDLLRLEIPSEYGGLGLDFDQRVVCPRADRHRSVIRRIAGHAHVDRDAADRVRRHRRAERPLSPPPVDR